MFAQEFMRNALVAGSVVGVACGLIGWFVVLRAQVFAGDALSHVAFTGALAAAAAGIDLKVGLFVACIGGGIVMGALGDRARADDVVIGTLFAWSLGLGWSPLPKGELHMILYVRLWSDGKEGGDGTTK